MVLAGLWRNWFCDIATKRLCNAAIVLPALVGGPADGAHCATNHRTPAMFCSICNVLFKWQVFPAKVHMGLWAWLWPHAMMCMA